MSYKPLTWALLSGCLLLNMSCGRLPAGEIITPAPQSSLPVTPDLQPAPLTPANSPEPGTASPQAATQNTPQETQTAKLPVQLRPGQGLPLPGTLIAGALDRLSPDDAVLVLEAYARDIFGASIQVRQGPSSVGDLNLPLSLEPGVATALELAEVTYFGLLSNGVVALSLGSGTNNGDLTASIQQASLAMLSFRLSQGFPPDGEGALQVIQARFPGLAGQFLSLQSDQDGYTFSTGKAQDWTLRDGTITLKNSHILAGVSPGRRSGQINIWVVVACGLLAVPFLH